jgi:hypothetical protein
LGCFRWGGCWGGVGECGGDGAGWLGGLVWPGGGWVGGWVGAGVGWGCAVEGGEVVGELLFDQCGEYLRVW